MFIGVQYLGRSKITDNCIASFEENILRLDITMANIQRVQITQSFENLIENNLDF
jgi:hypothetical protein